METVEKAQERERVLFEGYKLFEDMKSRVFAELFDIINSPQELKISDYCRVGFSQGYLEGHRKAKGEAQPETKAGNPMPEILPGYLVRVGSTKAVVVQNSPNGLKVFNCDVTVMLGDDDKLTEVWDRSGVCLWRKE
jgi:hypothetical protein